ncbi:MAG TPA: hypothetical protein VD902_11155, partial [Symbiobacteriaceae bacterium]|nr:hypothetical protein [Symbiobacteriaceae bacterium]
MSLRDAAAAYGLDCRRLVPVASAYRAAAAYRCGRVLLKPYRYGRRQLYYVAVALRHLEHQGFGAVPRLVATRDGEPYFATSSEGWYATTWIDGTPPRFPRDLNGAARSLAGFHQASEGCFIPYSHSRSWQRRWQRLLDDLRSFSAVAGAGIAPFDRDYARLAPLFIRQAEVALQALEANRYAELEAGLWSRQGFCH